MMRTKDGGTTWGEGRMTSTKQWFVMSVSLAIRSFLKVFKESRYFTETSCQETNGNGQLIHITIGGVRLYVKENKAILENSSEDKDHGNDAKH